MLFTEALPVLLDLAGNASYLVLQSFPFRPQYRDLEVSILV